MHELFVARAEVFLRGDNFLPGWLTGLHHSYFVMGNDRLFFFNAKLVIYGLYQNSRGESENHKAYSILAACIFLLS